MCCPVQIRWHLSQKSGGRWEWAMGLFLGEEYRQYRDPKGVGMVSEGGLQLGEEHG